MIAQTRAVALLALVILVSACGSPASTPGSTSPTTPPATAGATSPEPAPTAAPSPSPIPPSPTSEPLLAEGVVVAGIEVGGLSPTEARGRLERELAALERPVDIRAGEEALSLRPDEIAFAIAYDAMLDEARGASAGDRVPLSVGYDEELLRQALAELNTSLADPPSFGVISDTETISRSFTIDGGLQVDIDQAVEQIDSRLRVVGAPRRITLALTPPDGPAARPDPAELQAQIEAMAAEWPGIVGIFVYDLAADETMAALNAGTAFSAASTIKTPIMLNAYVNLPEFSERQDLALRKMIEESDNLAANAMLSYSIGGGGTEEALAAAERMSEMLADLGLANTFQYAPFEATDYIRLNNLKVRAGPARGGEAPYTDASRYLRTTPREMAEIYLMIDRCARGEGQLLEEFADTLTPERCQEMLDRLAENADGKRMVAGIPDGVRVEHKSGWIAEMQADVGIVRSPGGDYLVAIYVYQELGEGEAPIPDRIMMSTIAAFSRITYTFFNPVPRPA